jgi:hypothetical protein
LSVAFKQLSPPHIASDVQAAPSAAPEASLVGPLSRVPPAFVDPPRLPLPAPPLLLVPPMLLAPPEPVVPPLPAALESTVLEPPAPESGCPPLPPFESLLLQPAAP